MRCFEWYGGGKHAFSRSQSVMVMKHLNIVTRDMNINAIHFQHTAVSGASENNDKEEHESAMKHLNMVTRT